MITLEFCNLTPTLHYIIQPPKWRTIRYRKDTYYLPFPRMLFWTFDAGLSGVRLSCGFLDDENNVYFPCLGNISGSFEVCLSNNSSDKPKSLKEAIDSFWQSKFNNDVTGGWYFIPHYANNIHPFEIYGSSGITDIAKNFESWQSINWKKVLVKPEPLTPELKAIMNKLYETRYVSFREYLEQYPLDVVRQIRAVRPILHFDPDKINSYFNGFACRSHLYYILA